MSARVSVTISKSEPLVLTLQTMADAGCGPTEVPFGALSDVPRGPDERRRRRWPERDTGGFPV